VARVAAVHQAVDGAGVVLLADETRGRTCLERLGLRLAAALERALGVLRVA
jgi:hypothetical protein